VAAAEEERFVRIKHVAGFPAEAARYCCSAERLNPEELNVIAVSRNPCAHLWTKAHLALGKGLLSPAVWQRLSVLVTAHNIKTTLAQALHIDPKRLRAKVVFVEHHRAHIASSFYPSGWDTATLLSLDGFGDSLSGMWGVGHGTCLSIDGSVSFPHSLGVLYTAITQFLGFLEWGDEYKVMGLAAYGQPERYRQAMEKLAQNAARIGYRLGLPYFRHHTTGVPMTWAAGAPTLDLLFSAEMERLLGPHRLPGAPVEQRHADIAAALQERLETVVLRLLEGLWEKHRIPRLCYAGGVALNCVLNGKISRQTPFRHVFIQPAAHDAGTSLGAALYAYHHLQRRPRAFTMTHAAWGPDASEETCRSALESRGIRHRKLDETGLCETAADALSQGKIVGWFQGRMEFGPRSLGHRSLLADPRDPGMKDRINERIKRRESFRPFAPSVLAEKIQEYFPEAQPDPFMLFAYPARAGYLEKIPAVLHADGTGRLQAVRAEVEELYWKLIHAFESRTGIPILLNTSFNEREPIVCRPEEAIDCFQRNAVDCLAIGPFWVEREASAP